MEFASEMVVKATLVGLKIAEVPATLSPDGRDRPPHLRPWRDGWRHLRFLFIYSPQWLFLYPGIVLGVIGTLLGAMLTFGPREVGGVVFDIHTLVYAGGLVLVGAQAVFFAVISKVYAMAAGLLPETTSWRSWLHRISLEHGIVVGIVLVLAGFTMTIIAISHWGQRDFGPVDPGRAMRWVVPSVVLLALGAQTIFSSFFLSLLGMGTRNLKTPGR